MTGTGIASVLSARVFDPGAGDLFTPDDVLAVRLEARAFAEQAVAPVAHRIACTEESLSSFPREAFEALAASGLLGVPFPASVGGRGLDHPAAATVAVVEELAYHSNSVAAIYDVHCILAGQAIHAGARTEEAQQVLHDLVRGSFVASFATSEPAASSDLSPDAIQTVAEKTDQGWIVRGRKRWITNSPVAEVMVCLCRYGSRTVTLLVDLSAPGVTVGSPDRKMGNRGQLTAEVHLDGVEVSDDYRLGEEGGGLSVALRALTYGRIGIGSAGVGMAQRALDLATERLTSRHAFGRPLGANQYWQFRMADLATRIEMARTLCLKAALRLDRGDRVPEPQAAMAKIAGTEVAVDAARDTVQIHGGYGFVQTLASEQADYPVEALYRDSKIGEIYEGANELQRWIIARQILGRDITG